MKNATSQRHITPKAVQMMNAVININTATIAELETLKRIGEKKAVAIVAYRKAHGAFKSLDDLTQVKGISVGIVAVNKDQLKLN